MNELTFTLVHGSDEDRDTNIYHARIPLRNNGAEKTRKDFLIEIKSQPEDSHVVVRLYITDPVDRQFLEKIEIGGFVTDRIDTIATLLYGVAQMRTVTFLEPI